MSALQSAKPLPDAPPVEPHEWFEPYQWFGRLEWFDSSEPSESFESSESLAPARNTARRARLTRSGAAAVVLASALTASCAGVSAEAARIEGQLVGLRATTLRTCLGDAPYFEVRDDGSELWAYTDRVPTYDRSVEVSRAIGQGTAFQRPRVESGTPDEAAEGNTGSLAVDLATVARGQCLFIFGVDAGVVKNFESRGRSSSGLNADAICTTILDRCIPAAGGAASDGS